MAGHHHSGLSRSVLLPFLLASAGVAGAAAQSPPAAQGGAAAEVAARGAALDQLVARLRAVYVFPAKAEAVAARIAKDRKSLVAIADPKQFAEAVQARLKEATNDVHLAFFHDPAMNARLLAPPKEEEPGAAQPEEGPENFGFRQVTILDGNIGLLQLDRMADVTAESGARAIAAMAYLGDAGAIIIDLRRNPGGSGRMNQLLSSYFFPEDEDKWLVSNENRSRGTFVQEWTQPFVPGKRLPKVPLYFLVSHGTGSAAEGFAYNLQALGRATVVGEATAGAAHSGDFQALPGGFVVFMPSGRTINPVTKTNWEGTGVKPDFPIKNDLADEKAMELIWSDRLKRLDPASPEGQRAAWQLAYFEAKTTPVPLPPDADALLGTYGERESQVTRIGTELFLADKGQAVPNHLLPLKDGSFVLEGRDYYGPGANRVRPVRAPDGRVTGLKQLIRHQPHAVLTLDLPRR